MKHSSLKFLLVCSSFVSGFAAAQKVALEWNSKGQPVISHEVLFRMNADVDPIVVLKTKLGEAGFGEPVPLFASLDRSRDFVDYWYRIRDIDPQQSRSVDDLLIKLQAVDNQIVAEPNYAFTLQGSDAFSPRVEKLGPLAGTEPWTPAQSQTNPGESIASPNVPNPSPSDSAIVIFDSGLGSLARSSASSVFDTSLWPIGLAKPIKITIEGQVITLPSDAVGINTTPFLSIPPIGDPLDIEDENGHGTHCASVVASYTKSRFSSAYIIICKVATIQGYATSTSILDGIEFCAQAKRAGANIRVISLSWGGDPTPLALYSAIKVAQRNDILVVCSAGNGHESMDLFPRFPASFCLPSTLEVSGTATEFPMLTNILTVSSVAHHARSVPGGTVQLAGTSNYGLNSVHVCARGELILSLDNNGQHTFFSGTSAAAANASGAAGMLLTLDPTLTAQQLKHELIRTAWSPGSRLKHFALSRGVIDISRFMPNSGRVIDKSPAFQVLASPGFLKIKRGQKASTKLHVETINGFTQELDVTVSLSSDSWNIPLQMPPTDLKFDPRDSVISGSSPVELTISTTTLTQRGLYFITVRGSPATGLAESTTTIEVSVY